MKSKIFISILLIVFVHKYIYSQSTDVSSMEKNISKLTFSVSPNPIVKSSNKLQISKITVTIPKNYFAENATMVLEPMIMYAGNGVSLKKSITITGETVISTNQAKYSESKTFSLNFNSSSDIINYFDEMGNQINIAFDITISANNSTKNVLIDNAIKNIKIVEGVATNITEVSENLTDDNIENKRDINTILAEIDKTSDEILKAKLYSELGEEYYKSGNIEGAISAYEKSIDLRIANNLTDDISTDLIFVSSLYFEENKFADALENYNKTLSYIDTTAGLQVETDIYNNIAVVYQAIGETEKATESFYKAYEESVKNNKEENGLQYLYQISNIYTETSDFDKAIENYEVIIDKENSFVNTTELAYSYNNLATLYLQNNNPKKAEELLENAIEISTDSSTTTNATVYNNLGNVYFNYEEFNKALEFYQKSNNLKVNNNDSAGLAVSYFNLANTYFKLGNVPTAIENFKLSLGYARENIDNEVISKTYFMLSELESQSAQCTDVIDYYKNYITSKYINTSSEGEQISEHLEKYADKIKTSSIEYLLTQKDLQIKNLSTLAENQKLENEKLSIEKELTESNNRKLRNFITVIIIALAIFLILCLLIFREYKLKKKAYNELIMKNAKIASQNEEIISQSEQLKQANEEILTINEDLFQQKEELQTTLENLQTTQNQLIQSAKMASLGQLIAGIAHELNTPLGAIKSSISTVTESSVNILKDLPKVITMLSAENLELFIKMIDTALQNQEMLSSREERKVKKELQTKLEEENVSGFEEITSHIIDMGIYNNFSDFENLYKDKNNLYILECAYKLTSLNKNSNNIKIAVENASKIIVALKNYSHSSAAEDKVNTDINNNIEIVLTIYHNQLKHGVEVIKKFEKIPEIKAFPDQLNQIWTNLIHNAIQAMDYKGKLELATKHSGNKIVISVKDFGKGIPDEIKDKIFVPFFTTKLQGEGTGLGLDIVRKIVENHNGKIYFETKLNEGTTFFVELPISND